MSKADDLTGKTFNDGMITVVQRAENKGRKARWLCSCQCGKEFVAYGYSLRAGLTKSCGCLSNTELGEEKMKRPSASLGRLRDVSEDPYQNLANAIVAVAVDDYRLALQEDDDDLIKSLEKFFYSEWYKLLTNLNPKVLLELLRKENRGNLTAVYY